VDDELLLAVDVALAARRPLLLGGKPGSGTSSLAAFLARNLGWRYYEHVIDARTRPRDLLWTFDAVRKLADASSTGSSAAELRDHDYVQPGVLWWAMDPASARRRGLADDQPPPEREAVEPNHDLNESADPQRAVVLVDEIDKADPDLPNGLLVPLGSTQFRVEETGSLVSQKRVEDPTGRGSLLVVITTNEERELPPAFIRRCITYELRRPDPQRLVEIGRRHLLSANISVGEDEDALLQGLAGKVDELAKAARNDGQRAPSTAEFLDALFACRALEVTVGSGRTWTQIERLVLRKEAPGRQTS
jgi:MoxR-like ATPase